VLELEADITDIQGAEYNPRKITEQDLEALRESINRLGIVKPIIVRNKTIVAGHQRTKSLRAIGVTRAPVYWLQQDTNIWDEVRFNQLHNGTELDFGDENIRVTSPLRIGFNEVSRDNLEANFNGQGAIIRRSICELVGRYGPWGACVASPSGEVIHAAQYALAAAASGVPLYVYVVPEESTSFARAMLSRAYGRFSYDGIERNTYIQSLAQPPRPVNAAGKVKLSRLYAFKVEPLLAENPSLRVLDFGAGRGECARQMRARGFHVRDIELFRRANGNEINKAAVWRMISQTLGDIRQNGQFDMVVCQAVLNSIDSLDAEAGVVGCCCLFCKPGGQLVINGRSLEHYQAVVATSQAAAGTFKRPEFLDEHGFSSIYRDGRWFFQKYYTIEQAVALIERFGFEIEYAESCPQAIKNYWVIVARKVRDLSADEYRKHIDFEFELPWPDGSRVGRSKQVREAFGL